MVLFFPAPRVGEAGEAVDEQTTGVCEEGIGLFDIRFFFLFFCDKYSDLLIHIKPFYFFENTKPPLVGDTMLQLVCVCVGGAVSGLMWCC